MPELLRERRPRSRGRVRCSLCHARIPAGMVYQRDTIVYDGCVYDWCECPACEPVMSHLVRIDWRDDDGITVDDAIEWAMYYASEEDARARVLAAAYLERCGFQTDAERDAKSRAIVERGRGRS